jgi:hypothetical protein
MKNMLDSIRMNIKSKEIKIIQANKENQIVLKEKAKTQKEILALKEQIKEKPKVIVEKQIVMVQDSNLIKENQYLAQNLHEVQSLLAQSIEQRERVEEQYRVTSKYVAPKDSVSINIPKSELKSKKKRRKLPFFR